MTTMNRLATACCVALALAVPASAQMLRVDVPFEFNAGNQRLASGTFRVTVDIPAHAVYLNNGAGSHIAVVFLTTTQQRERFNPPSLVFHKYGAQYFLRSVHAYSAGVTLPVAKAERFAQRAAAARSGPELALVRVVAK